MKDKPMVGQNVCLNDFGMRQIGGITSTEMGRQAENMIILYVDDVSMTDDVDTFIIEVDQPLVNKFLIDNHCVDLKV
ncbi:MAG: hypothetical protein KAS32_09375 [Candidatus Peribacteraceae bacterium]|nr:hypothetical protein [Candidatus Peribacteraceae bacterium]